MHERAEAEEARQERTVAEQAKHEEAEQADPAVEFIGQCSGLDESIDKMSALLEHLAQSLDKIVKITLS